MKKKSRVVLFPLVIFFLTNSFPYKACGQARWSGTITLEEKLTGDHMTSIRKVTVSFVNALPTLHRDDETTDLNFTDDKGTGTVSFHAESFINGKKWSTTDCQGGGQSELHEVVVNEEDNTYSIHAIGPACTGQVVDHLGGPTTAYGPEFTDLSTSDQQLVNKNHLAGTKSTTGDVAGLATVTTTITWNLDRTGPDVILIVTPEDYDNWMPEPGKNESVVGNQIKISLKLQKRNGQPAEIKAKTFELRLLNTSKEPGITINYPINPGTAKPDLRFQWQVGADTSAQGQFIKINCSQPCLTGSVKLGAYDGGGWTTLTAVAVLTDNTRVMGTLLVPGGDQEILIPKRKDAGSKIATKWLNDNNNPGETDDRETSKNNSNNGDGLSAYEEYRGVISEIEFKRTNPNNFGRLDPAKKEMGVCLKRGDITVFSDGIRLLDNAADIKSIRFLETEIDTVSRRFNKNALSATIYKQYVQRLFNGSLAEGVMGENQPIDMLAKTPEHAKRVIIDIRQITRGYQRQANSVRSAGLPMPYTLKEDIANTVAHELGHGISLNHHGIPTPQLGVATEVPPNTAFVTYHVYDIDKNEILRRPYRIEGQIGAPGNDESGDLSCIMAYTSLYQWVKRVGADATSYFAIPPLAVGEKLCTTKNCEPGPNTCINADGKYFSEATYGECAGKVKFK